MTQLADLYYGSNRSTEALALLNRVLKEDPHNPQALTGRGLIELNNKQVDQALADFQEAVKVDPAANGPKLRMAQAYVAKGNFEQAKATLQTVLQRDPKSVPALLALAELENDTGHSDDALNHAKQILAIDPHFLPAKLMADTLLLRQGDTKVAGPELRAMLPSLTDKWMRDRAIGALAQLDVTEKNYQDLRRLADIEFAADPKSTQGLGLLALSYPHKTSSRPPSPCRTTCNKHRGRKDTSCWAVCCWGLVTCLAQNKHSRSQLSWIPIRNRPIAVSP